MQFIKGGPDVPERLLQAHEEGRVVFFCGAGISYPAGLPTFAGLVTDVCRFLSYIPNVVEQTAIRERKFDAAIALIEQSVVGGRETFRFGIANALQPDYSRMNATRTHEALLLLAKNRFGKTRLVTTNFDRIFEKILKDNLHRPVSYIAPHLPIPKESRFDGIVYLHGLLPNLLAIATTTISLSRVEISDLPTYLSDGHRGSSVSSSATIRFVSSDIPLKIQLCGT